MLKKLSENAETILKERYYLKDKRGRVVETWPDLCNRVVDCVVPEERLVGTYKYTKKQAEKIRKQIFEMVNETAFLPNSPALFNSGVKGQEMLSACFVIDVEDSLDSIYGTIKKASKIQQLGGGVGLSFQKLRCRGSKVSTTGGASSGAVSFIKAFAGALAVIEQGGRRRGANIAVLPVWHADVEEFLEAKQVEGEMHNFNFSVALTDAFMEAVEKDLDWDLIDPKDNKVVRTLKARELMDKIVDNAWLNGEPGAIYIDTVNRFNPVPQISPIFSPNPCAEFFSVPMSSCNLGSLSLPYFISGGKLNKAKFNKYVRLATLFLDCMIEACDYPLEEIDKTTKSIRKVGLGLMGLSDALILMNMKYNSKKSYKFAESLIELMSLTSLSESVALAKRAGRYEAFLPENHKYEYYKENSTRRRRAWKKLIKDIEEYGLRNAHTLVQAPTGTLSRIADVSIGVEPIFSLEYDSNILNGKSLTNRNKLYDKYLSGDLKVDKKVFVSAKEIPVEDHIEMQAHIQTFLHNGISKTANLPNDATREDIFNAYILAWKRGCKGLTVYREGSRTKEVITSSDRKMSKRGRKRIEINKDILKKLVEKESMSVQKLSEIYDCSTQTIRSRLKEYGIEIIDKPEVIERPDELDSKTYRIKTSLGNLYLTIGFDEKTGLPLETILNIGKSSDDVTAMTESIGKLASVALQHNVPVDEIIKTIDGIGGGDVIWHHGEQIKSIPDALAKVLSKHVSTRVVKEVERKNGKSSFKSRCPHCGCELIRQEGCFICENVKCNYTKCG